MSKPVATPFHSPGNAAGAIASDRLAKILNIAEDGIITINSRSEIVLFNCGAAKIFGYEPAEVIGKSLDLLLPPRVHAIHRKHLENFVAGATVSRPMGERGVVFGVRKDGSEFPAEATISKLDGGDGEMLLTAIVRDAADRKRYEDALLRLNQDLEERVRQRTAELAERNLQLTQKTEENETFVYSVSHDLRSPLVNLEGFSEELQIAGRELLALLEDERLPPELRERAKQVYETGVSESISFIRTAVSRLGSIIDALLRLSRAGRVVYQIQNLDMNAIARRVVDSLRRTVEQKKAQVTVGDLPPARGDATAVEQVLANLVGNALNYLDAHRPGQVEIGATCDAEDDAQVRTYFVRDNGVGIPAAYLPKLFQALQRLHPDKAPGE
jgi:PAS domain S-box-containing protein